MTGVAKMLMAAAGAGQYASTYSITPAANNIDEGSPLTINVSTTNVLDGTILYWTANPSNDLDDTDGSIQILNNSASFTITPTEDFTTYPDNNVFAVELRTTSISGTIVATSSNITINDTSRNPNLYKLNGIEYASGFGTGPNIHSLEGTSIQSNQYNELGLIIYNFSVMPDNRGFLATSSANNGKTYFQSNFELTNGFGDPKAFGGSQQGLFKSQITKTMSSQSDVGYYAMFIDSTTIITAKTSSITNYIKKYTLSTAWDISTLNSTPTQTATFGDFGNTMNGDVTLLKFNSTGTELIVGTHRTGGGLFKYTLSTPYDITTMSSAPTQSDTTTEVQGGYITDDGTKILFFDDIQDYTFRTRTMSTAFDLSTLSTQTTVNHTISDVFAPALMVGIAWNETTPQHAAGTKVYFAKGWSSANTIHIGTLSTAYDMSTVTWDNPIPNTENIGKLIGIRQTNIPAEFIRNNACQMDNNENFFSHSRYISFFKKAATNTLSKETWELPGQDTLNNGNTLLAPYHDTEYTNWNDFPFNGATGTTANYTITVQSEGTGVNREWYMSYFSNYQYSTSLPLGPVTTRNITSWIEDNGPAGDATFNKGNTRVVDCRFRHNAAATNSNLDYKFFALIHDWSNPEIYWLRQATGTSSAVETAPSQWNLDTGLSAQFVIPRGGTHEPAAGDDIHINSFDVSADGDYMIMVTNQSTLHVFELSTPWDLGGTITAVDSADIPLLANNKPSQIWYNYLGNKIYILDSTALLYEYFIGEYP